MTRMVCGGVIDSIQLDGKCEKTEIKLNCTDVCEHFWILHAISSAKDQQLRCTILPFTSYAFDFLFSWKKMKKICPKKGLTDNPWIWWFFSKKVKHQHVDNRWIYWYVKPRASGIIHIHAIFEKVNLKAHVQYEENRVKHHIIGTILTLL